MSLLFEKETFKIIVEVTRQRLGLLINFDEPSLRVKRIISG